MGTGRGKENGAEGEGDGWADRREAAFAPTPIDVGADRLLCTFLIRSSHHALEKSAMAPSHLALSYLRLLDLLRSKPTNCHYQKR